MKLIPAAHFTFEQLTEAYNQTRVDYLVPMPMNVARLREYVHAYDVDLAASIVSVNDDDDDDEILGIGMLGVRPGRGWITRLGVLPTSRRKGVGRLLMDGLLAEAEKRSLPTIWLEVIKGNQPAYRLFRRYGFVDTRELVVARRPPTTESTAPLHDQIREVVTLDHEGALDLLEQRRRRPNWLLESESMRNIANLTALDVTLKDGGRGWVVYHAGVFQLTRIVVDVPQGDPAAVSATVLQLLHQRHSTQDAVMENLPVEDPLWQGFQQAGYFEAFRRLEMVRET